MLQWMLFGAVVFNIPDLDQIVQHTTTHCNTLLHIRTHFSAPLFSISQILIELCNTMQHTATHCNTLFFAVVFNIPDLDRIVQHNATHCNTLQHTATHFSLPLFSISQILIELSYETVAKTLAAIGFHRTCVAVCVAVCCGVCCSVCSALQCVAVIE